MKAHLGELVNGDSCRHRHLNLFRCTKLYIIKWFSDDDDDDDDDLNHHHHHH